MTLWKAVILVIKEKRFRGTTNSESISKKQVFVHQGNKYPFSVSYIIVHDKTNKKICAPSEDSDQPGHPPSLIRVFAVRSLGSWGPKLSSCGQRRLCSDWADAQADLSLRWAQRSFCWFCHEAAHIAFHGTALKSADQGNVRTS